MKTVTTSAIYRNGVLELFTPLSLPDETVVQIQVVPELGTNGKATSLFGAFPELAVLDDDLIDAAKEVWRNTPFDAEVIPPDEIITRSALVSVTW